jgi:acyl-coenzyme A thioesterase PaaI-like protein
MKAAAPNGPLPWTRSCFVCGQDNPHGLRARMTWDGVTVRLPYEPRPSDLGYSDIVHGGLGATLLDEVMTWSANLAAGTACVAAEFTVRLLKPMRLGQRYIVEGGVAKNRGRIVLTEGAIRDALGQDALRATGKYMPVPGDAATELKKDFVESPDVLPIELILHGPRG